MRRVTGLSSENDRYEPFSAAAAPDLGSARKVQESVRKRCIFQRTIDTGSIESVAGADVAYAADDMAYGATVVMSFTDARFIEAACSVQPAGFPYIPGLFAFREGPVIVESVKSLSFLPDILIVHGHGYAHPLRAGLACHLGIVLGIPVIGVAGNLLTGASEEPAHIRFSSEPVLDAGEVVGMAVRTKWNSKPVYVSAGHYVDLGQAVEIVLAMATVHRFPEPLYQADQISRGCRRSDKNRLTRGHSQSLA
ncbi:MAG TPA: endonuclease V [Methanoregulaceae archaeon]|nr:endonuclease V [Methanoregulaceae archaeon]